MKTKKYNKAIVFLVICIVLMLVIMAVCFAASFGIFKKTDNKKYPQNNTIKGNADISDTSKEAYSSKDIIPSQIVSDNVSSQKVSDDVSGSKEEATEKENVLQKQKITEVFPFKCEFQTPKFLKNVFYDSKNGNALPYRLVLPQNYDPAKKYPVILFLHGAGEIGTDNEKHLGNAMNMFSYNGDLVSQAFVVCPQSNEWWHLDRYMAGDAKGTLSSALNLLNELASNYSFDSDRMYVTGLSMGGYATWSLLEEHGELFAAGIPICGGGNTANATVLKEIPIRIYHSYDDPTVSFTASWEMYDSIIKAGGKRVELIDLDGLGHNCWDYAFSDRDAFCWLFSQNKAKDPNGGYEYIPYFKVVGSQGECLISDKDIETIEHFGSYINGEYIYSVNICLKADSASRVSKIYKSHRTNKYTVYWLDEKIYTYIAEKINEDNLFVIQGIFSAENVDTFYKTVSKSVEVLNNR